MIIILSNSAAMYSDCHYKYYNFHVYEGGPCNLLTIRYRKSIICCEKTLTIFRPNLILRMFCNIAFKYRTFVTRSIILTKDDNVYPIIIHYHVLYNTQLL